MNRKLFDALESCLQRMEQKEPLDTVLTRYPLLAAQLRPLLETAMRARSARVDSLPLTALARQRSRGLALAADLRQGKKRSPMRRYSWRPAMTILSVLAILVLSSNGLLIASAHSIPGDTLYPLKRSVESTQLHLLSDPGEREALEHTFDERRVDETRSLITGQRVEDVDFTGLVSSQSESEWQVSGIPVIVSAHTEIDGDILVGDEVEVHGATNASGSVVASRLSPVRNSASDDDRPEVSPTLTPSEDSSGESDLQETPAESSVTPAHSGEGDDQASTGNDRSSEKSHEDYSSREAVHASQLHSDGGGDQHTGNQD